MSNTAIKLLGVGSIDISTSKGFHIYVDSFNTINPAPLLTIDDIVVFTHADGDHFCVESILSVYADNIIIGPPSIVLPLVKTGKINPSRLRIEYPEQINIAKAIIVDEIKVSFYQSKHFIDWNPIHCSYLFEIDNKKVYITGDSNIEPDVLKHINCDCIICNLVDKGFITKTTDPKYAVHNHMSYLINILSNTKTDKIIANHLIGFDGTIEPKVLKDLVYQYGFCKVIVPETSDETTLL